MARSNPISARLRRKFKYKLRQAKARIRRSLRASYETTHNAGVEEEPQGFTPFPEQMQTESIVEEEFQGFPPSPERGQPGSIMEDTQGSTPSPDAVQQTESMVPPLLSPTLPPNLGFDMDTDSDGVGEPQSQQEIGVNQRIFSDDDLFFSADEDPQNPFEETMSGDEPAEENSEIDPLLSTTLQVEEELQDSTGGAALGDGNTDEEDEEDDSDEEEGLYFRDEAGNKIRWGQCFYFLHRKFRFFITPHAIGDFEEPPVIPEWCLTPLKNHRMVPSGIVTDRAAPIARNKTAASQAGTMAFTRAVWKDGNLVDELVNAGGNRIDRKAFLRTSPHTSVARTIFGEHAYIQAARAYKQQQKTLLEQWGSMQRAWEWNCFRFAQSHYDEFQWPSEIANASDVEDLTYTEVMGMSVDIPSALEKFVNPDDIRTKKSRDRAIRAEQFTAIRTTEKPWQFAACTAAQLQAEEQERTNGEIPDFLSDEERAARDARQTAALQWNERRLNGQDVDTDMIDGE